MEITNPNSLWDSLSEEAKKYIKTEYKSICKTIENSSFLSYMFGMQNKSDVFKELFGENNLEETKEVSSYKEIAEELFPDKKAYRFVHGDDNCKVYNCSDVTASDNCVTKAQAQKILAINRLMNVAKFYNKNWKPDYNNFNESKYYFYVNQKDEVCIGACGGVSGNVVEFKKEEYARKALEILGEDLIKRAYRPV